MADIPLSDALGGAASSGPRRETYVLTASNAALAVPSWAQGGKGFVIVNGVGPGGSGSIRTTSGQTGAGGGAGGIARDVRISIPSGTTTLNAVIAAAGAAVTGAAATVGANGGDSSLTVGSLTLVLGGGQGGQTDGNGGRGGYVYFGAQNLVAGAFSAGGIGSGVSFDTNAMRRGSIELTGLVQGTTGQPGGTTPVGNGPAPSGSPTSIA